MEEYRERLEQWINEYYRDNTFNTCEHQLLLLMEGPWVWIKVVADTMPMAIHTPSPFCYTGRRRSSQTWTGTSPWES
jgi:hypothetical protein